MEVMEVLDNLKKLASKDPEIKEKLLATHESDRPISTFCSLSRELGYPLYDMDLISAGEDYYAAMRRSTNGGGENSPALAGEDDYYELFITELKAL